MSQARGPRRREGRRRAAGGLFRGGQGPVPAKTAGSTPASVILMAYLAFWWFTASRHAFGALTMSRNLSLRQLYQCLP